MYHGFFYILLLVAVVALHCLYTVRKRKQSDAPERTRGARIFLWVLSALCALAVAAGLAGVLTKQDPAMPQALGGFALLLAIWFDFRLGK